MKESLALLSVAIAIPLVSTGIGVVTPQVEAEARRLWEEFCSGRDGGENGDLHVYCKISGDTIKEVVPPRVINVAPKSVSSNQVIFVRPPQKHFKHDIVVKGSGKAGQKTVIYVLPSKHTNNFKVKDETKLEGSTEKPVVYFLKKDHGSRGSHNTDYGEDVGYNPGEQETDNSAAFAYPPSADQPEPGYEVAQPQSVSPPEAAYLPPSNKYDEEDYTDPPAYAYLPPRRLRQLEEAGDSSVNENESDTPESDPPKIILIPKTTQ